jgi:hypothetical protein
MAVGVTYVIRTTLPPEAVTRIGMEIYALWVEFAMGQTSLGGKRLMYPTGRYASSIEFKKTGEASVGVIADEAIAPEAKFIEHGHGAVDLKLKFQRGRPYPMHRPTGDAQHAAETGLKRVGSGPPGRQPRMWAEVRSRESSGYASIGVNSSPGSWVIPPMTPYAPSLVLSAMIRQMLAGS